LEQENNLLHVVDKKFYFHRKVIIMSNRPDFPAEAGSRAEGMGEELRERGQELREELGRLGHQAKEAAYEQVEQRSRQLEEMIEEQPLRSVLIAAGIGFVLGVMWSRD
jgi:ElaB/YqjD/DUF883 family membrane-anchored ribosome-binding protein